MILNDYSRYADQAKFKGVQNIASKMNELVSLLANFNVETLVQFFSNK